MKIIDFQEVDINKFNNQIEGSFIFVRVDPGDYKSALLSIMMSIVDKSWLNVFDNEVIKRSFEERANTTIKAFQELFKIGSENNPLLEDVGEYIVSYFALKSLSIIGNYNEVPLMELIGEKETGNPGFDFYSESIDDDLIICGEAKYLATGYGYNSSLKQINDFIINKKHIIDAQLIQSFVNKKSLEKLVNDDVGICSAFSSNKSNDDLFKQIANNEHFIKTLKKYKTIIMVAVEI